MRQINMTGTTGLARNDYEHIIRDEQSGNAIREYIRQNPARWTEDEYYCE